MMLVNCQLKPGRFLAMQELQELLNFGRTCIARELGVVVEAEEAGGGRGARRASARDRVARARVGDSVAIDELPSHGVRGACTERSLSHAVPETIARTTLGRPRARPRGERRAGGRERAEARGHYVQGHVDAVGAIQSVEAEGEGVPRRRRGSPTTSCATASRRDRSPSTASRSTVAELRDDAFAVALVPHTLAATTLRDLARRDGR